MAGVVPDDLSGGRQRAVLSLEEQDVPAGQRPRQGPGGQCGMAFVRGHHLRHHGDAEAGFHYAQHGAWLREFENDVGCNFQPGERPVGNRIIAGDIFAIRQPTIYPWIVPHERQSQKLEDFPHLKRWFETIRKRPATIRAPTLSLKP